jgi:hypothetical protein
VWPAPLVFTLQLRLPALLASHTLLAASAVVRACVIPEGMARLLLGRAAAVAVGVALDLRRRARFMREQQYKQQQQAGIRADNEMGNKAAGSKAQ